MDAASTGAKKKLLLVEDEVIIAMSGKASLQKHGCDVAPAFSGEQAITCFGSTPDIILVLWI